MRSLDPILNCVYEQLSYKEHWLADKTFDVLVLNRMEGQPQDRMFRIELLEDDLKFIITGFDYRKEITRSLTDPDCISKFMKLVNEMVEKYVVTHERWI